MKRFLTIVLVILAAGGFIFPLHAAEDAFPANRHSEITYKAFIDRIPKDAQWVRLWVPLASTRDGQTVLERDIRASAPYEITVDPVYGNEMAYVSLKKPWPEALEFQVRYRVKTSKEDFGKGNHREENIQKYLKSSRLMGVNEEVRRRTEATIQGKKTWMEQARAIYEDVIWRMTYDKTTPGWGEGNTLRACLLGKGNCTDFHSLFISMAHAADKPARFKIGLTIPDAPEGEIPGYHCWAEFYDETVGWQPVDASEAWKDPGKKEAYFGNFDTHKFLISVGRDIDLIPRQSGSPVNIFFYPYMEVDGKAWDGVKTSFHFKNLT